MSQTPSHSIAQTTLNKSVLFVNVKELNLNLYNEIIISWNIIETTSMHDWIGIYKPLSIDSSESLDSQKVNGSKIGHLTWSLNKLKELNYLIDDLLVEFRYYSGLNPNTYLAKSVSLKIIISPQIGVLDTDFFNPLTFINQTNNEQFVTFRISDLKAAQLRKGMFFNPDPYVKISIIQNGFPLSGCTPNTSQSLDGTSESVNNNNNNTNPNDILSGYAREYKTFVATNTCFPNWKNDNFLILSKYNDQILFEVKDKFARTKPSINRFLGRVLIDLESLIEKTRVNKGKCNFSFNLTKRTNNDNVTGSLSFSFCLFTANKLQSNDPNSCSNSNIQLIASTLHQSLISSPSTSLQNYSLNNSARPSSLYCSPLFIKDSQRAPTETSNDRPIFSLNCQENSQCSSASSGNPTPTSTLKYNSTTNPSNPIEATNGRNKSMPNFSQLNDCSNNSLKIQKQTSQTLDKNLTIKTSYMNSLPPSTVSSSSSNSSSSSTASASLSDDSYTPVQNNTQQATACSSSSSSSSNENDDLCPSSSSSSSNSTSNSTEIVNTQPKTSGKNDRILTTQALRNFNFKLLRPTKKRFYEQRSKSLERIKYTSNYNQICNHGKSHSNPCSLNSDSKRDDLITKRQNLYLKRNQQQINTNLMSQSVIGNLKYRSESNISHQMNNLNRNKKNDRKKLIKEQDVILNDLKKEFNQIVKLLRESRQNNIPYEDIKLQIQKSFIDNVLVKLNNLSSSNSSSCSMLENFYINPLLSENLLIPQTEPSTPTTSSNLLNYRTYRKSKKDSCLETQVSIISDEQNSDKLPKTSTSPNNSDLPPYWEARVDQLGRVFYIDHLSRTTTWKRPKLNSNLEIANQLQLNTEIDKQRLDKRYQSIRRTMTASNENSDLIYSNKSKQKNHPPQLDQPSTSSDTIQESPNTSDQILKQPGALFILRQDLQSLIKRNQSAKDLLKQSSYLIQILQKIRANPSVYYKKYQHNKELVKFLNMFSDPNLPLPAGWETKYEKNNKVFFVDHNSRSTTFIDPRLPLYNMSSNHITTITTLTSPSTLTRESKLTPIVSTEQAIQAPSFPPPPPPPPPPPAQTQSVLVPVNNVQPKNKISYSDRVVGFLQQNNIFENLKKSNITLTSKQKDKINLIRQNGRSAYDRMSSDLDLASLISQLEDSIMSFSLQIPNETNSNPTTSSSSSIPIQTNPKQINNRRDYQRGFHSKLRNFYRKLESKGYGQGPQKSKIVIRRDKLLDDARIKFMQLSRQDLRKNKLFICFQGEEGLDYGGPAREFFYLLSRQLFNPYYGLFEYSASDMYTVQISQMSSFQEHVLEWFQFAGRVLALALIHQYLLDAFFTRPFYKALLRDTNWTLGDLETLDPEYCQSLTWIKDNDITDILDLTFSVTEDKCGQLIERDLKENGRNIAVTEKNKLEYIQRIVKWRVERGVQKQTEALVKGFYEVLEPKYVQIFDARELELVLCGTVEIDINDWKKNTDYRSGYNSTHQIVLWFWQAVDKFDNEQKLKLLQFVTGTSSIPYEGFAALRGSNGPRKFCIERWGTPDALPRAHTCFNRLDLPPYQNFETLFEKLLLAIEETSGFSIQ